jgi:hypothetical protein
MAFLKSRSEVPSHVNSQVMRNFCELARGWEFWTGYLTIRTGSRRLEINP